MNKIGLYILILLVAATGCTPVARYKSGPVVTPEEKPPGSNSPSTQYTSADYRRLGLILRDYLGRPYRGSSKYDPGLDCSKFTREVFKKFADISLPRTASQQYQTGTPVHRERLFYGDLVFFNTDGGISHVGVYVGNSEFIHASSSNGIIISKMSEHYWGKRYVGGRRILE
jgi:cell wall-associated NlpC family hydrolase